MDKYKNRVHSKNDLMKIGVVVHGPEIVDSGYAKIIMEILQEYGAVKARLGGTMGRTAVLDAKLEDHIDISQKLLPSESVHKFVQEQSDAIFLINYGKSSLTGHTFGYKIWVKCRDAPLVQIERPGEEDGSVVLWKSDLKDFAEDVAEKCSLSLIQPDQIVAKLREKTYSNSNNQVVTRKIAGVSSGENIFVNGIVLGKSNSSEVTITAKKGILTDINGGKLKKHGVEKLGKIDLAQAIIKTGLLRKSVVKPRILNQKRNNSKYSVAYLNHAAEDIYKLKDVDMVVTVGDDTTLVAADILYRFNVPIIGITDGDLDKVVKQGYKAVGSLVVELETGWDDFIGEKIFSELFNGKETIEIENIENFKSKLLQIIDNTTNCYDITYN